jgi:hypothetical protein
VTAREPLAKAMTSPALLAIHARLVGTSDAELRHPRSNVGSVERIPAGSTPAGMHPELPRGAPTKAARVEHLPR